MIRTCGWPSNDWRYVQAQAVALGADGSTTWGASTNLYRAWDNQYVSLPPVSVNPSTRAQYNLVVIVSFFDANKRLVGTRTIAPEVGAWWMSYPAAYGGYWCVGQQSPDTCA